MYVCMYVYTYVCVYVYIHWVPAVKWQHENLARCVPSLKNMRSVSGVSPSSSCTAAEQRKGTVSRLTLVERGKNPEVLLR
jgi:hypothetical protein